MVERTSRTRRVVTFHCASKKESAQTIRASEFPGRVFTHGDLYLVRILDKRYGGVVLPARVNRADGSTIKIVSKDIPGIVVKATVGFPTHYDVELEGPYR